MKKKAFKKLVRRVARELSLNLNPNLNPYIFNPQNKPAAWSAPRSLKIADEMRKEGN